MEKTKMVSIICKKQCAIAYSGFPIITIFVCLMNQYFLYEKIYERVFIICIILQPMQSINTFLQMYGVFFLARVFKPPTSIASSARATLGFCSSRTSKLAVWSRGNIISCVKFGFSVVLTLHSILPTSKPMLVGSTPLSTHGYKIVSIFI